MADVIRDLHVAQKNGNVATSYLLERHLGLKGSREGNATNPLRNCSRVDERMGDPMPTGVATTPP
jgi:hypothetical protein